MGIVDMIGANIGLAVTLDLASCEFQGQLRSLTSVDLTMTNNQSAYV